VECLVWILRGDGVGVLWVVVQTGPLCLFWIVW
jgi:hypothetical protein